MHVLKKLTRAKTKTQNIKSTKNPRTTLNKSQTPKYRYINYGN